MKDSDYLILHVVRGEATFDVAEKYEDVGTPNDPAPWYITSLGWRAYPYWMCQIKHLLEGMNCPERQPPGWTDFMKVAKVEPKKAAVQKVEKIDLEELGL